MSTHPGVPGRQPLLAAATVVAALAFAPPAHAARPPAAEVLRLVNAARAEHGVPPLRTSRQLASAARRHSVDMVEHRYFAHASPAGERPSDRVAASGWLRGRRRWRIGENLAWGHGTFAPPAAVVAAWLRSPPHRRVMLRRAYRVVGIGVVDGTPVPGLRGGLTYTAEFGG